MNQLVESAGGKRRVTLPDALVDGQEFPLTVDGQTYAATWLRGPALLVLRDGNGVEQMFRVRGQTVQRFDGEADASVTADLVVRGKLVYFTATIRPDVPGQDARAKAAGAREQVVRSQITGKVLKVLVKAGDAVEAGQTLLVVEAMKMENRIFTTAAGKVQSVTVKDGDPVQTGKELVRIAP